MNELQWILQIQEIDFVSASADWLSSFKLKWPIYCSITGQNKNPSEITRKDLWVKNKRSAALHTSAGPCRLCPNSSLTQRSDLRWAQDKPQEFQIFQNACSSFLKPCSSPNSGKISPIKKSVSDCVVVCHLHLTMITGKWHVQHNYNLSLPSRKRKGTGKKLVLSLRGILAKRGN